MPPISDPAIAEVFSEYPVGSRKLAFELREMIFEAVEASKGVNGVAECLKWGQPTFLAQPEGVGSTVRIGLHTDGVAMYFICNTNLVDSFRQYYAQDFTFEGNRALVFELNKPVPKKQLSHCIGLALTYHARKKPGSRSKP